MIKVTTTLIDGMHFESHDEGGLTLSMDAAPEFGGKGTAMTPKKLLLAALAGCTGMDVVSILHKMKVTYDKFYMEVEGDLSNEDPKVYTEIRLVYHLKGSNLPKDKIEKAIHLSQDKYCSVSTMLRQVCPVNYSIIIE